jgi:hypothetical protein
VTRPQGTAQGVTNRGLAVTQLLTLRAARCALGVEAGPGTRAREGKRGPYLACPYLSLQDPGPGPVTGPMLCLAGPLRVLGSVPSARECGGLNFGAGLLLRLPES